MSPSEVNRSERAQRRAARIRNRRLLIILIIILIIAAAVVIASVIGDQATLRLSLEHGAGFSGWWAGGILHNPALQMSIQASAVSKQSI
jgi:hypothetical protein